VRVSATETHGAYTRLEVFDSESAICLPGQFHMLMAADGWGGGAGERPFLPRALSHSSSDGEGTFSFILEAVGPGTARLCSLQSGDEVHILGPLGNGFDLPSQEEKPILVAGGIGLGPILSLADALQARGVEYDLICGFRSREHALFATGRSDARIFTDDGSVGEAGFVSQPVAELLRDQVRPVAACGPPAMLEAIRALSEENGVDAELALESPMACGFGSCFGCAVETKEGTLRLCVDGPVLRSSILTRVSHDGRNGPRAES
jgi:NAD(P)H-flavin reductase